jgi:hypothetical protein
MNPTSETHLFDTHVCLISAQATPNLLPVLDERWRPARVVLAASPQMQAEAHALRSVIQGKGIGVKVDLLALPDAYDYASLTDSFLSFLARQEGQRVALNVTGGTKLMAVAAQEVFRANDQPVLYVNVETDEVIVLGQSARSQPLQAKLRVRDLLESHRFGVEQQQHPVVTAELRDLTARVIDHVGAAGRALGQLNLLAVQARGEPQLRANLNEAQRDSRSLAALLDLFASAGKLALKGESVRFINEEARAFINGGWLELNVYNTLRDLQGQHDRITDVAMNLKVQHPDGRTRNEVDVAFLYKNTLHLIECKTANLASEGAGGDDKATEAIYKMEALLKLGGLRTKGMIVDYRGALSDHAPNLDRARSAGIQVVSGTSLRDIKGCIRRAWLSG